VIEGHSMSLTWRRFCARIASGEWLEPRIVTYTAVLTISATVISMVGLFATSTGTLDLLGRPLGTDFSSFWTAGLMALEDRAADAYVWGHHRALQAAIHGNDMFFPWSYPPMFLMVAALLALLPYVPALILWQGASVLAALAAFRVILPSRRALMLAAGFPVVLTCLSHGQTGFLTAALLAGGVLLLRRYEIWAGILFGLLAYKPQFGLLIPFVLLAGGHWRAIASATITVIATAALPIALWGWPVWQAFFDSLPLTRKIVFELGNTGWEKFQSMFAWVRMWGGSIQLGYGVQSVVSVASVIACVWIWRGQASRNLKAAALLSGALLSSPYILDYDFIVLGMALAFFAAHALETGFRAGDKTMVAFVWAAPGFARPVAEHLLFPLGFFTLAGFFFWVTVRAYAEERARVTAASPAAYAASTGFRIPKLRGSYARKGPEARPSADPNSQFMA
jgi:hypothetical protein